MTNQSQDQAGRLHDSKIKCLSCVKKIMSYPCFYCGVEPYDGHEINGCCYQSRTGSSLSHSNARDIGINCNVKASPTQDQAVREWMESLGFKFKAPTIQGYSVIYTHPDLDVAINAQNALFFYTICQKAEREGYDKALDQLQGWADVWNKTRAEDFNYFGAIKSLKVSKEMQLPFVQLTSPQDTINQQEES